MRCSDKGFLPISQEDYLSLLDWTARQPAAGKRGRIPPGLKSLFERLGLDAGLWLNLVNSFGKHFFHVAGLPGTIEATTSRVTHKHDYVPSAVRKLFSLSARISSS